MLLLIFKLFKGFWKFIINISIILQIFKVLKIYLAIFLQKTVFVPHLNRD